MTVRALCDKGCRVPVLLPRLVIAALAAGIGFGAQANPQGASVVSGQVGMVQDGAALTIANSPGAIIN